MSGICLWMGVSVCLSCVLEFQRYSQQTISVLLSLSLTHTRMWNNPPCWTSSTAYIQHAIELNLILWSVANFNHSYEVTEEGRKEGVVVFSLSLSPFSLFWSHFDLNSQSLLLVIALSFLFFQPLLLKLVWKLKGHSTIRSWTKRWDSQLTSPLTHATSRPHSTTRVPGDWINQAKYWRALLNRLLIKKLVGVHAPLFFSPSPSLSLCLSHSASPCWSLEGKKC